jgi:hypothetical protein
MSTASTARAPCSAAPMARMPEPLPLRRMGGDPAQANARRGVRAGAEGEAGVQADHLPGLHRRLVPGRHDPERGRDLHRRELRLREAHPVLLRHLLQAQHLAAGEEVLRPQQGRGFGGGGAIREQRQHARALPALLGRGHAGLAEEGLLGVGLGVRVLDRDAQRVQRLQRLADGLDPVFGAEQAQLKHRSAAARPPGSG